MAELGGVSQRCSGGVVAPINAELEVAQVMDAGVLDKETS